MFKQITIGDAHVTEVVLKRLYNIRRCMISRCTNPRYPKYEYCGGRGISICKEWMDKQTGLSNFITWALANGYQDDLTIDRENNDGDYTPSNCRWVTRKVQARNRRTSIIYKGKSLREYCQTTTPPISYHAVRRLLYKGESLDAAITRMQEKTSRDFVYTL